MTACFPAKRPSQTFDWTVTAVSAPPQLANPGNQVNAAGDQVSLSLSASDPNGAALTYTAANLPAGLTIDPVAGTISGTLANSAASANPYNVTVTASDGTQAASQSFHWTVNFVEVAAPGDQSNVNGDSVSLQMSATDAGSGTLSYSATGLPAGLSIASATGLISGTVGSSAAGSSPYTSTVTASDGTHSANTTFTWNVAHLALTAPPNRSSVAGATVSLQLAGSDADGDTLTYGATGLPTGLSLNSSTGLISGTIGLAAHGASPYQVTATASDGTNSATQSFTWTVSARVALADPGAQSNAAGDSVSLQVHAASLTGATLSYSASGLPSGLSINSSTGLISGTIAANAATANPYAVTVTASDGSASNSQSFHWSVATICIPAVADQTNYDGDTVSLSVAAGYHGSGTLSYSATGLPDGLTINGASGLVSGAVSATADVEGPFSVTVTASDGTSTATQTFNWTINPVVSVNSISDENSADGDSGTLSVSATDALNRTLTYSGTGLPPGMNMNSTTGIISGTIALGADSGSPYAVTVTASDGLASASQSFNWIVTPISLANPGPQTAVDGGAFSLAISAHDPDGDTLTFSAAYLPPGLSINAASGVISGTLTADDDGWSPYPTTVTASDGSHNATETFAWTVTKIGLANPGDQTDQEGDNVSLQLAGSGVFGTLSYSAGGLPDGLSINPSTGLVSGTILSGAAADGPFSVTIAVSDGTNAASQQFNWTVNPIVNISAINDQTNEEGDSVSLQVSATDALGGALTYSADGLPSGLSMASSSGLITGTVSSGDAAAGPYYVTVIAADNTYSGGQTFNWNVGNPNNSPPTLTNPGTQSDQAGDNVALFVTAGGADGDSLSFTATNLPDGLSIDPYSGEISGTVADDAAASTPYAVSVTVADIEGATATHTFNWFVNAGTLSAQANSISAVEGNDTATVTVATFTTSDLNSQASDFTATVNWGDGTSDEGTVQGGGGSFTVTDDHVYAEQGNYSVSVAISEDNGAAATATTTATVSDAPLTITGGFELGAIVNQSSSLTLAAFTDGNPYSQASDFTATIDWGDGTAPTQVSVSPAVNGLYQITGQHTYTADGSYTATITLADADGASSATTSTVAVGDLYAGEQGNLTLASFTDTNPNARTGDFTVTIQWGDGTSGFGTVSQSGSTFVITGAHTYAADSVSQPGGVYQVGVTVTDDDGSQITASKTVEVVRPPIALLAQNLESASGASFTNVEVASFTEADTLDSASEFQATIDWGDGQTSSGTVVGANGSFQVLGSHCYTQGDTYCPFQLATFV